MRYPKSGYSKSMCLLVGLAITFSQAGCYYLRVSGDKKLAVLRRSPVSFRKMTMSPSVVPPYQQPAGFSQTYKDYLYTHDPYQQPRQARSIVTTMHEPASGANSVRENAGSISKPGLELSPTGPEVPVPADQD